VPRHYFFSDDPRISRDTLAAAEAALKVLEGLGASIEEVTVPMLEHVTAAHPVLMLSEAFAFHQKNLRERPEAFGDMSRARFLTGGLFTAGDYVQAQRVRNVLNRQFNEVLETVDLIATPTMSNPPGRFDEVDLMGNSRRPSFTSPFNMTGMPAVSVPCGFTPSGLPAGLQLAGQNFDEPTVLRAAYAYQQATAWHERRPSI
jgi:aspartyl-tRNA(Asn)/glutamyl-tRNA(Gln) amidotransferase subunit A